MVSTSSEVFFEKNLGLLGPIVTSLANLQSLPPHCNLNAGSEEAEADRSRDRPGVGRSQNADRENWWIPRPSRRNFVFGKPVGSMVLDL